ncbi:MAG: hypothetical protein OEV40_04895 [Acidimicrobiia bacterium]|nr:hypothetical protein [Acidimicrobiia bacterium]
MLAQDSFDWRGPLEDTFGTVTDFVPKLLLFLAVLLIGLFVARWIRRIVHRLLTRINFDTYIDRAGLGAPLARAGFADSGRFLAQIIYYLIVLMVLQMAFDVFGANPITEALDGLVDWLPKLVVAIVLVIIGGLVANVVGDLVGGATAGQTYGPFVTRVATIGVWLFFGLAALDQIEIGRDLVDTLTTAIFASLSAILIIKFGVGGVWAARDRFWPNVYDSLSGNSAQAPAPAPDPASTD